MKFLKTIIVCIAFITIGSQLQKYEVISHPAYWALFGATGGFAISQVWR